MNAGQAVEVIGVSLVILVVMIAVMARVNWADRERIERRREAWKAAGSVGPRPESPTKR
jgi:uncharacterized membrane protein YidH (DUF202 family)